MSQKYDLFVIGGGAAGLVASKFAARLAVKTLLVERDKLGGDCTWTGCVPSKSLLHCSQLIENIRQAESLGIAKTKVNVNFDKIKEYVKGVVEEIYATETPEELEKDGVDVIIGEAKFISKREIEVNNTPYKGKKFIIATGASPFIPPIDGIDSIPYLTSETIFSVSELPEHLIVLGGGPIGSEMSQAFRRLGSEVTIIDMMDRILARDDPDSSAVLMDVFKQEGIDMVLGEMAIQVESPSKNEIVVHTKSGKKVTGSHLLVAVGRRAVWKELNLEAANVQTEKGRIKVNNRLRTTNRRIFAAGDCTSLYQFTHIAGLQGFIAARNAILPLTSSGFSRYIPWTTFTDPEVAHVRVLDLEEGLKEGKYYEASWPLDEVDRAKTEHATNGFVKVFYKNNGKIVGASIVAPNAGEMIHEYILAVQKGMKLQALTAPIHVYPSYSAATTNVTGEVLKKKVYDTWIGKVLKIVAKIFTHL